jgi:eukaryotic-like serine/threonine-protein kinase
MSMHVGQELGPYRIAALLGKGGMGEVYLAHDTKLKRDVAIKMLPDQFAVDAERLSRFQREAEVLASLNHPNIAAIYGIDHTAGSPFLVLELAGGETLEQRIARGRLELDEALSISRQIADALEAAHDRSVIHRDLKPANIKITPDGRVKVLDFGLAKIFEGNNTTELSNSPTLISQSIGAVILGTVAYMSPEQARGKTVDARSDIWAFGCLLYEMLAGRQAFQGETTADIIGEIVKTDVDLSLLPAGIPDGVRAVLRRCMKRDIARRYRHISDVRLDLEESSPSMSSTQDTEKVATPMIVGRPNVLKSIALLIVIGVITAAVALGLRTSLRPEGRPPLPVRRFAVAISPSQRLQTGTADRSIAQRAKPDLSSPRRQRDPVVPSKARSAADNPACWNGREFRRSILLDPTVSGYGSDRARRS